MKKIQAIQAALAAQGKDVAVVSDPVSINYLTGYFSDPHERQMFLFIFKEAETFLFLPALDVERATKTVDFPVHGYVDSENPWAKMKDLLPSQDLAQVLVEYQHLILAKYEGLKEVFPAGHFSDLTPTINGLRLIKSEDEIEKMMIAGEFADRAVTIGFEAVKAGKTETDIIAEIEFEMKKQGVEMSFETMVLSADNAANPHGIPGPKEIEDNALLLFDLGIKTLGYCSDMTRTIAIGQPSDFQKEIYHLVLKAQEAALDMIKPGVTAHDIDRAARQVIEDAGYGQYFNHRLGHGIGMDVHEFPSIMEGNDMVIQEGMCFSVEPGVYIPGKVGVRIEDCGVVTKDGFKLFTSTSKDLLTYNL